MNINEYSAAQRVARMRKYDDVALCVVALVCVLLCMGVLFDAALKSEARAAERTAHAEQVRPACKVVQVEQVQTDDDGIMRTEVVNMCE